MGTYNWLDTYNNYIHSVHNHGDFGYGQGSTSHIEAVWANLKSYYKKFIFSPSVYLYNIRNIFFINIKIFIY